MFGLRIYPSLKSAVGSGVNSYLNISILFSSCLINIVNRLKSTHGSIEIDLPSNVTPIFIDAKEFTWSFLFIEHWSNDTPSNFLWIFSPTDSQSSQFTLSTLEAVIPDDKLRSPSASLLKGLWLWNQEIKVDRSLLSRVFRLCPSSKCCSLDLCFFPVKLVIASCMAPHLWAVFAHNTRTDSVTPRPLVMPPLLFRDLIMTCSIIKSDHNPAQNLLERLMVW